MLGWEQNSAETDTKPTLKSQLRKSSVYPPHLCVVPPPPTMTVFECLNLQGLSSCLLPFSPGGQTLPGPRTHPGSSHRTQPHPLEVPKRQLTSLLVFLLSGEAFTLFRSPPRLSMLVLR